MQRLRIFAGSPSDLTPERAKVTAVAGQLKPLADSLDIVLDVADWAAVVPDMGRPQQVIFDQLQPTAWDVFIGLLWHRFGTAPASTDPATNTDYRSGTEEEFRVAYQLWRDSGRPRIMIYRCTRPIPTDAIDPDEFKRVKEFFSQFDATKGLHPGLYATFETLDQLEKSLLKNLQILLLQYAEVLKGKPVSAEVVQAFAPQIPNNLPRRAPFFGRDDAMATVMRALSVEDRTWGVLLDGIGGIGKTSLAVEAAYRCKDRGAFDAFIFVTAKRNLLTPGGIRDLVPLAPTLDEFLDETARVLGYPSIAQLAGNDKRRALIDGLRTTRALLVYDNIETLPKEAQEVMADFLRELPQGCKAIITSRRRGGEGAVWLRLEKLEWEAARAIIGSEMERDAQLSQKLQRVGESRWQELYDETRGSPLALVHTLGLMRVRPALTFDGALELLRAGHGSDLQRFVFQEARKELGANDEAALCALSLFAPSASLEAWLPVSGLSLSALDATIDRLSALSLVDMLSGEERFALHPLTRSFVRDELFKTQDVAQTTKRFTQYWVDYATECGTAHESYRGLELLKEEWSNLEAAAEALWQMAALHGPGAPDRDALRLLNDMAFQLSQFLFFSGYWDWTLQLSDRGYEAARFLNDSEAAGARAFAATWICLQRGDFDETQRWLDRCADSWLQTGSPAYRADIARLRGLLATKREDLDAAEPLLQESLRIYRQLESEDASSWTLVSLGNLEKGRRAFEASERYFREALAVCERTDNVEGRAVALHNLGELGVEKGEWSNARANYEAALPLARRTGRRDLMAGVQGGLARVLEAEGRSDEALPLAVEAHAANEELRFEPLARTSELVERLRQKVSTLA